MIGFTASYAKTISIIMKEPVGVVFQIIYWHILEAASYGNTNTKIWCPSKDREIVVNNMKENGYNIDSENIIDGNIVFDISW